MDERILAMGQGSTTVEERQLFPMVWLTAALFMDAQRRQGGAIANVDRR
jgi:hypothetical protein